MRTQVHRINDYLQVQLDMPAGTQYSSFALFVHFFPPHSPAAEAFSLALTQAGLAVLRLPLAEQDTPAQPNMLLDAYRWLAKEYEAPGLFVGHSLAGSLGLLLRAQMPGVHALALLSAVAREKDLHPLLDEDPLEEEAAALDLSPAFTVEVDPELLDQLHGTAVLEAVETLDRPLLLLHSPQDKRVPIDAAAHLYKAARHSKSFVSLDGADHVLSKLADARYAGQLIAQWAFRYLPMRDLQPLRTHMEVICRTPAEDYTTEVRAGNHSLLADEPESLGGADLGPTPYDLLTAALGTCTSMTLQMYARRKKWPLKEAIVHLKHDKVHAEDCLACDAPGAKIDELSKEIELVGPLDEKQRARLLEIADRCPVHKTLLGEIRIKSRELKQ